MQLRICEFLTKQYGFNLIDYSKIDPMFLEQILGIDLPFLKGAEIKTIWLNDLKNFSIMKKRGIPLKKGRYYQQLITKSFINSPNHKNNFINQTNENRLLTSVENMKKHNYGSNGSFIILYNNSFVIRDVNKNATFYKLFSNYVSEINYKTIKIRKRKLSIFKFK